MKKLLPLPDLSHIVADESVDFRIVKQLRLSGFEVYAVCEKRASISDDEVLKISNTTNALLITEDKDFGELVFRFKLPHKGVLLIRIENAAIKIDRVVDIVRTHYAILQNTFSVLNEKALRIKI